MPHPRTFLGLVFIALTMAGCADVWKGEPAFQTAVLMPAGRAPMLLGQETVPVACEGLLDTVPGQTVSVVPRNACIYAMMSLIDRSFNEYRKDIHRAVDVGHAATDIIGIGLGSAGALVGGATTKAILAATSAAVAGARGKIDADILYSNSISLIITQMEADRADWKSRIITQMTDPTKSPTYSMYQAANDLVAYFEAGTWNHALVSLDTHASANLSNCQAAVKGAQTAGGVIPDIACGPIPVVTPVAPDVQTHRAALAAFVKGLSPSDRLKLSIAMSIPTQPTDAGVLKSLLESISAATTADQANAIAAKIKTQFKKDV